MTDTKSDETKQGEPKRKTGLTRRSLLTAGGGLIVGAGLVGGGVAVADRIAGGAGSASSAKPAAVFGTLRRYMSTMVTTPITSSWTRTGASTAPGYIFATPLSAAFDGVIMDNSGEPVWIEPNGLSVTDLRVQQYQGKPVITYWVGSTGFGHGTGHGVILDASYRTVATVYGGKGMLNDLHEFNLTTRGSALVTSYPVVPADLSALGGPKSGWILGCHVQEIDVATGKVLLDWNAVDHIDFGESYQVLATSASGSGKIPEHAWDPYHLNAIADDGDNILISSRHAHTIYSVDRSTGDVRWRLGGKKSDFAVASDAAFAWQHHVRRLPDGRISLFNNGFKIGGTHSAGLILDVDETAKTARLSASYTYGGHLADAEGSLQVLPNGNVFVGWGDDPVATEFTKSGTAIYEARNLGTSSYRAFRFPWRARPAHDPDIASYESNGSSTAYVSWNGATEVTHWRFLAGASVDTLATSSVVARSGFETSATIPAGAKAIGAEALDASGAVLGRITHTIA